MRSGGTPIFLHKGRSWTPKWISKSRWRTFASFARGVRLGSVSFNNFGLSPEVVRGTQAMGFAEPTPIQLRAFPIILSGKDLVGTAQTGTGKTAAFALPILTLLAEHGAFRCLVLEPTRELAAQVETAFRDYGRFTDIRVTGDSWRRRLREAA